jgi:NitT/TauT family transport system permease protein
MSTVDENPLPRSTILRERLTTVAVWICRVAVIVVPLHLWEIAAERGLIPAFVFSRPTLVWDRLWGWILDGTILSSLGYTLANALIGYVLGLVIGATLAVLLFRSPAAGAALTPFITMLNAVPRIAFAPLLIGWLGFGVPSNVALVVLVTVTVNFYAVYSGLTSIEEDHLLWSSSLGATERQLWTSVRMPSIVRWVLSALRVSIGLALSAAIVSEFVGSGRGIGYLVSSSTNLFRSAGVYAGMAVVIAVVAAVDALLRFGERRLTHWIGQ